MLLAMRAKFFFRKSSYLNTLLNSVNPENRHAILRHFSLRVTSTEFKSRTNSGFLEKFLEEGHGASVNHIAQRHQADHQDRLPPNCNHLFEPVKNNNRNARNIKSVRAKELGEALLEWSKSVSTHISNNDGCLDLMAVDVTNLNLHSYDPVYLVVKPFQPTTDDILAGQENLTLEADVTGCLNYKVTFLNDNRSLSQEKRTVTLHCSSLPALDKQTTSSQKVLRTPEVKKNTPSDQDYSKRPCEEKLELVFRTLKQILPRFFVQPHDYSIYHPDIVFENNIRGLTTVGIAAYVKQLAVVRLVAHLKFAHVRMDILKITKHPEDSTVRVRWRIRGLSGLTVFLKIWKIGLWNWKQLLNQESDWYDGFSIFYVGGDGLICRHICDKMMPDEEKGVNLAKGLLATKLAFLLGLSQRPFLENLDATAIMLVKLEELNYFGRPVTK